MLQHGCIIMLLTLWLVLISQKNYYILYLKCTHICIIKSIYLFWNNAKFRMLHTDPNPNPRSPLGHPEATAALVRARHGRRWPEHHRIAPPFTISTAAVANHRNSFDCPARWMRDVERKSMVVVSSPESSPTASYSRSNAAFVSDGWPVGSVDRLGLRVSTSRV
jgi:hypothetical protein